jgi:hypothetical protein
MNDIEEKFFKTFGIEPKELEYPDNFECYPEITDKILLELIYVIIRQNGSYQLHIVKDIIDLKEQILKSCILLSVFEEFKNVVQSLFTEEEE